MRYLAHDLRSVPADIKNTACIHTTNSLSCTLAYARVSQLEHRNCTDCRKGADITTHKMPEKEPERRCNSQRLIRATIRRHHVTGTEKFFEVVQRSALVRIFFASMFRVVLIAAAGRPRPVGIPVFVFAVLSFGFICVLQRSNKWQNYAGEKYAAIAAIIITMCTLLWHKIICRDIQPCA